jgi:hypothetical protein
MEADVKHFDCMTGILGYRETVTIHYNALPVYVSQEF